MEETKCEHSPAIGKGGVYCEICFIFLGNTEDYGKPVESNPLST